MADNATHPYGAKISYGSYDTSNPETPAASYTELGQLIDTAFPEITTGKVKATRLNQSDNYKRKRPGMNDAGDTPFRIHYNKSDYNTLKGFVDARSEKWWKVEAPEGDDPTHLSKDEFHGFICKLGQPIPDPDSEEGLISTIEICVNGKPQFTAYS